MSRASRATPTSSASEGARPVVRGRAAGLLLHPTSLPSRFGIGDLGPGAVAFLDWAASAGQSLWQVLPLGPTGHGNSPYACLSAFAGNPLLVSPELLHGEGLLSASELALGERPPCAAVDYPAAARDREAQLRASWSRFRAGRHPALRHDFEGFREHPAQLAWLEDWTLFAALKRAHGDAEWTAWDPPLRDREASALAAARRSLGDEVDFHAWSQFLFFRQWHSLRSAAGARGIRLLGDVPIYVAPDSADAWARRELFALGAGGLPVAVAGVPPDYFSPTGQLWGNPLYRWERVAADGFSWWVDRLRLNLALTDLVRLDHFRGFAAYWAVPAAATTAEQGRWERGPGAALFDALAAAFGELPIVAEDLGVITPDVVALRDRFALPGMAVLQFGLAPHSPHAPHLLRPRSVVYTGTHDNDTTRGWFEGLGEAERRFALDYLGGTEDSVARDLVRTAYASVAELAVVPLQDALGLGREARMNTPGRPAGNWEWRVLPEQVEGGCREMLARFAELTGRHPADRPAEAGEPYPPDYPDAGAR